MFIYFCMLYAIHNTHTAHPIYLDGAKQFNAHFRITQKIIYNEHGAHIGEYNVQTYTHTHTHDTHMSLP